MYENAFGEMEFRFTAPSPVNYNRQINYLITGTAKYGDDYTVAYSSDQPLSTSCNGAQGNITLVKNSITAILRIKPVADAIFEPDETITVTLVDGGDYSLGTTLTLTDTIKNDDHTPPVVIASGATTICTGQNLSLTTNNTIDGEPVYAYSWSNGATDQTINITQSGSYVLTVYTANGFSGVSAPVKVTVFNTTAPALGADVSVNQNCYDETVNLTTLFNTSGLTATWNTPTPTAAHAGNYRLVAANNVGCTDTAYALINLDVVHWTGSVSSDWHNAANWSPQKVPVSTTHVIVSTGTPNMCIISTADAVAASLQDRNGAVVKAMANRSLTINGKCLALPPN